MERRKQQKPSVQTKSFQMRRIKPLTDSQRDLFDNFSKYNVINLTGCPGTVKTFLAMFLSLLEVDEDSIYKSVKIVRSSVSVRDAGFLPGNIKEKMAAFEAPYISHTINLYGRGDAYEVLKTKKTLEFLPTAHLRGTEFNDCIVLIDECQNMSYQELNTIITRFGHNCKFILAGDVNQDDLTNERYKERSGYGDIMKILDGIDSVYTVKFGIEDIVRSGFVKDYIIAKQLFEAKPAKREFLVETIQQSVSNTDPTS